MTRLRARCHEILEGDARGDPMARAVNLVLIALILVNVAAIVLESVPTIDSRHKRWFDLVEVLSVAIFTLEYGLRVWSSVENPHHHRPLRGRLRYMATPLALIDLVAILPFYLGFLVPVDLRFVRVFRLFLVFKLTRYDSSMRLLGTVLRNEARPIAAALFILATLTVVVSSFAYLVENQGQPAHFASIPHAMYWAIVTMTTIGYGDVVPLTATGKILTAILGVIGLGMVALPAGLLASGFSEQLHQRRAKFQAEVNRILEEGTISAEEGDRLKELRDQLGLIDHQAAEMTRLLVHRRSREVCPHCGRPIRARGGEDDPIGGGEAEAEARAGDAARGTIVES